MKTEFDARHCEFMLHEDDWKEGEGNLVCCWDEACVIQPAASVKEVLQQVPYLRCDAYNNEIEFENDPCQDNEGCRFDADLCVNYINENIVKPTKKDLEEFKAGKKKLYALHVCVYITKLQDLDADDPEAHDYKI